MVHECKFEDKILVLCENVASTQATVVSMDKRINGSIDDFVNHIKHGHKWRATILTISIVVVLEFIGFAFMFGKVSEAVGTLKGYHTAENK